MTVRRIVVGADGSPNGRKAIAWAAGLAGQLEAHVTAVHAFDPLAHLDEAVPPIDFLALRRRCEAEARQDWCAPLAAAGVAFDVVVVDGDPAPALADVAVAEGADLIVVGARSQSALRGLVLGSTSLKLPHLTVIPVCIVHLDH